MDLVAYSQYYRTRSPERQLEIDECLRRNLNHPGISRMVLFCESDAPPVPKGTVPVEVVNSDERITYAEWFRWVQRQGSGIGLLLNADMYLDEGLEHLEASFNRPDAFLALTRYNPGHAGFHLNDYPHWTQDVWGVRADAELPESLLYASSFPLGFPGCDNRIAYVMWSHGFRVRNPCYYVRSVHLQASTARAYNKTSDRLYGGVSYVHPSLAPDEDAELEFTVMTRSEQRPAGVLINQQAIEQGVHQLRHGEAEVAQRFLDLQQFTGLSWVHEAVGSAHLTGDMHPFASEDTVFLPMPALLEQGVELQLPRPTRLEGLTLRLPRRAAAGYRLELKAHGEGEAQLQLQDEGGLALKIGGERRFWQPTELKGRPWQRLRVKLSGPAADPAWRGEEGAELVLFGEKGALNQAKSLNVIAEEKGETQPPRLLRTVRFAAPEEIDSKNLTVQEGAIEAADGSPGGDGFTASGEASALKYAYNSYSTSETGAYTASLVLKAGTQSRSVLRINDQSGLSDARQAFDLERGCKEGEAVTGGSASQASSTIRALGNGWYRCSISAEFNEPLTTLHAPAVWFEHYAPSSSTGTLYTGEAQVLQGVEAHAPVEPAEQPAFALSASLPVLAANADTPYRWRRRRDCQAQLASAEELHSYGNRFRVLRSGEELLFEDRFWPSVGVSPITSVPCGLEDAHGLLLWGFGQPGLELRPGFIASTKRFKDDMNFWQYPCITEGDAFALHQSLVGPQLKDGELQVYLGLPWATWIDHNVWPTSTLKAMADRLRKLRLELERHGIGLKVHSVCQQILWREFLHLIKAAGVDCLWLSHKTVGEDQLEGVDLKPWHLYAVNARQPDRRAGLSIKAPRSKRYLASFKGAHMDHYITDVRPKLLQFKHLDGFLISLNNEWHFNTIVYGQQVGKNFVLESKDVNSYSIDETVSGYNQVLSDSIFSLCPAGAGPNSLRLWESLATGSIPVILSDFLILPEIPPEWIDEEFKTWQDIVIFHPEKDIDVLEGRLRAISFEEIERRSKACIKISSIIAKITCFGDFGNLEIDQIPVFISDLSESAAEELPSRDMDRRAGELASKTIIRAFKPQQIHSKTNKADETLTGKDIRIPLSLALGQGEEQTIKVVRFDQVQFLTAVEINSPTSTHFKIVVERSIRHNKYEEVIQGVFLRHELGTSPASKLLKLPNQGIWAECLRLSVQTISNSSADQAVEVEIGFEVETDAFPMEIRSLDKSGLLNFASTSNSTRLDQTFLTINIANASVIEAIKVLEKQVPSDQERRSLFPAVPAQVRNLIDEEVDNGITMYVHLMNRNENIIKNLPNWLAIGFDELILLDWSTTGGITELPGIWDDPRVRIVRVEKQSKFIRTIAQNLASRLARNRRILKCDSDVEFKGDFFAAHPLEPGEFWVGEWTQARNHNERHLHGEVYYCLEDFLRIGGYDERIKSYGHDDTNLTDRLVLSGLKKKVLNYDLMHHQEHTQTVRAQGAHGLHPMVATYANRLMATYTPLWSAQSDIASFELLEKSSDNRFLRFELCHQAPEETNASHNHEAKQIIGSWYINPQELKALSDEAINKIIWEKQAE